MKVNVVKSGVWAVKGIRIVAVKAGVQDMKDKTLADELLAAGWAKAYEEKKELAPEPRDDHVGFAEEPCDVFDREAAEEEYRNLGGRVASDWTDTELTELLEKKRVK